MFFLNINGTKEGLNTFGCGTRFDWYVIQTTSCSSPTIVNDEHSNEIQIDMNKWNFLPNHSFDTVSKLITDKHNNIVYSTIYDPRKSYVSRDQTDEFKYPLIHATNKSGIRYCWSSRNDKGHFGIPKVIFGETGINQVVVDKTGEYGMTQQAMAIPITNELDFEVLPNYLMSDEFKMILNACSWSNYRIDWRLFTYFKPRFWINQTQ
jgi:hypothetical protein